MPSAARRKLKDYRSEIDRLWKIHEDVSGQKGPGARHGLEILNKAAIVLITACWEAYVEDVATEAFDFLLAEAPSPQNIPGKVQALAAKTLRESKNEKDVWKLAGAGWQAVLQDHRGAVLKEWVDSLNSPRPEKVKGVFDSLIGLPNLPSHWHWKNMSSAQASKKLDTFIRIRGKIAHRLQYDEAVHKSWSTSYMTHVEGLADCTDAAVSTHLTGLVGKSPW